MLIKFCSTDDMAEHLDVAPIEICTDFKQIQKRGGSERFRYVKVAKNQIPIHIIALGSDLGTGCFFEDTFVKTFTGQKVIQDLNVGDLVLTDKGRYRKILHKFENPYEGVRTTLSIACLHRDFISTGNQPVLVIRDKDFQSKNRCPSLRKRTPRALSIADVVKTKANFVSAQEVLPGDYVLVPIKDQIEDAPVFDEDDAYLMGYYLAEGCLAREHRQSRQHCGEYISVMYTMSDKDRPCLEKIHEILLRKFNKVIKEQRSLTSDYGVRLEFQNYEYAQLLLKLFGCDSTKKYIHPWIFNQSIEWKLKFLAAYTDGDGCLVGNDYNGNSRYIGTVTISTASPYLAYDLTRIFASVGITSTVHKGCNKTSNRCFGKKDHDIYALNIGGTKAIKLLQHCLRLQPVKKEFRYEAARSWISEDYLILRVRAVTNDYVENETKYNIEVEEDNTYVVDIAVHNSNRNQDLFKEADCIKCHHTFVKHGRAVHWSHVNKPTDPKYGDVYASDYNVPMRRIELLLGLDKDAPKNEKLLQNVSQGKQACFSMGCKVAHDICSICGHKAPTPQTRCSHIPSQLGELTKEGQIICMINPNPDFFDISAVHRNADRIAYSLNSPLSKHASFEKSAQDRYYDNIELAKSIYVPPLILSKQASSKRALLNKLSKMEKRIEAQGSKPEPYIKETVEKLNKAPQISDSTIKELKEFDHNQLLKALADKGIIFTAEEFFKYLFQDKLQDNDKGLLSNIKTKLPTMFSDFNNDEELNSDDFEPSEKHPPLNLLNLVNNLFEGHSLFSKPTHRRIISITIVKPKTKEVQKQASVHPDLKEFVQAFVTKYANYKLSALAYLEEKNKLDDEFIINSIIQNKR